MTNNNLKLIILIILNEISTLNCLEHKDYHIGRKIAMFFGVTLTGFVVISVICACFVLAAIFLLCFCMFCTFGSVERNFFWVERKSETLQPVVVPNQTNTTNTATNTN